MGVSKVTVRRLLHEVARVTIRDEDPFRLAAAEEEVRLLPDAEGVVLLLRLEENLPAEVEEPAVPPPDDGAGSRRALVLRRQRGGLREEGELGEGLLTQVGLQRARLGLQRAHLGLQPGYAGLQPGRRVAAWSRGCSLVAGLQLGSAGLQPGRRVAARSPGCSPVVGLQPCRAPCAYRHEDILGRVEAAVGGVHLGEVGRVPPGVLGHGRGGVARVQLLPAPRGEQYRAAELDGGDAGPLVVGESEDVVGAAAAGPVREVCLDPL